MPSRQPEVVGTEEFRDWFLALDDETARSVDHGVELLAAKGVTLGYPYSSQLKGTSLPLRELRVQSGGRPLRIFYAFDPTRDAVLLLGGDKTGDARFYERMIPQAEKIWLRYLEEQAAGLHDDSEETEP
ncbi:addiction module toxin RelE [Corallococcus interemptor]|uniref:Addiction module toxin RelE n=1 Tax=Corallococcus interemptor TaxID=2316720 RepID=A0A3A8QBU1_9BACT|nr:type II toxin-antitoxin system RelE/ParE family toxin [Corallococcus interemptor]RKH63725.1 addiction module toxin RelE [Corallococcus interemptor]